MSNKEKKVSVNQLDKINIKKEPTAINVDGVEIIVKHNLSLSEVIAFTKSVVEGIMDLKTDDIEYCYKDFVIAINMLSYYTNIRLPDNLEKQYEFITNSNIVDKVREKINEVQYWHILDAVDEQIAFEKDKMICQFKAETQNYIEEIKAEAEKIISVFEKYTDIFKNIEPEIITNIIPKLSALDNITKKDIVDTTMNHLKENNADI